MRELLEQVMADHKRLDEFNFKKGMATAAALGVLANPAMAKGLYVDPGHGGKDPGAVHQEYHEKDINLQVANKLASHFKDVKVSRDGDTFISLSNRAKGANEKDADVFVSIHVNSSDKAPTTNGSEVWYYTGSEKGKTLANDIATALGSERGVKDTTKFSVLKNTKMPAVLIELGFINDETDRKNLLSDKWQNDVAQKIANAIKNLYSGVK